VQPAQVASQIAWMEHEKLRHELIDYTMSVCHWFEDGPIGRMTNRHQTLFRFRSSATKGLYVWRTTTSLGDHWQRALDGGKPAATTVVPAVEGSAFLLPLDSREAFERLAPHIYDEVTEQAYEDLCGFELLVYDDNANPQGIIEYSDQLGGELIR